MSSHPLEVIAAEPPRVSEAEAESIAAEHYGLDVSASDLVSERDRNFHLRTPDHREFVLKIASAAEDPLVTECQIEALIHLESRNLPIDVPRIVRDVAGRSSFRLGTEEGAHVVRLVSWLPGRPLQKGRPSPRLCRNFGICAATLDRALLTFEHPGSGQSLLWNMNEAAAVRDLLHYVPDGTGRASIARILDHFETRLLPLFPQLRSQVIHNDLNPDNVLVDVADPERIVGVIDFGDMVRAPLTVDVAVAASYLRDFAGNPLTSIAHFVSAFHSVMPLERREIDILPDLVLVRLATTVAILHWRQASRGADDPYLNQSGSAESTAEEFLARLESIPRELATEILRQACASVEVAAERAIVS